MSCFCLHCIALMRMVLLEGHPHFVKPYEKEVGKEQLGNRHKTDEEKRYYKYESKCADREAERDGTGRKLWLHQHHQNHYSNSPMFVSLFVNYGILCSGYSYYSLCSFLSLFTCIILLILKHSNCFSF